MNVGKLLKILGPVAELQKMSEFVDVIECFNPDIVYTPGESQVAVDALSHIHGVNRLPMLTPRRQRTQSHGFTRILATSKKPILKALVNHMHANPDID